MGRPRKPSALAELHGDYAKNPQRRNKMEPVVETLAPVCPSGLTMEAAEEWDRVISELSNLRVIGLSDRSALYLYIAAWQSWKDALEDVRDSGLVLRDADSGRAYENPASKIACRLQDQMHKILCQFGLTPASRTRVNITEKTGPARMRRQR